VSRGFGRVSGTPDPPYYAVIFTSRRGEEPDGYGEMSERMVELASREPGFLGIESVREGAVGITVSYWASLEAIEAWRKHAEHRVAQRMGRERWYDEYSIRVARVERAWRFVRSAEPSSQDATPAR
jgi:heme-degrading monooxygenase HmoA